MKPSRVICEIPRFGLRVLCIVNLCARLFVRYKLTISLIYGYFAVVQSILQRDVVSSDAMHVMTGEQMLDPTYLPPIAVTTNAKSIPLRAGFLRGDEPDAYDQSSVYFDRDMALLMAREKAAMIEDRVERDRALAELKDLAQRECALAIPNQPPLRSLHDAKKKPKWWEGGNQALGLI